jgi:uncharacterized protein (TIGR02646 family)
MIEIKKGSEPKEWTAKCKTPDFTKYEAIPELRTALNTEQHGICAFCMRRIPVKDVTESETSKIAHLYSRKNRPDLQLKYHNMVASCPGKIDENGEDHCDKSQGPEDVTLPLHRQGLQAALSYSSKSGEIKCSNSGWDHEIQNILRLNHTLLKENRWEALEGVRQLIENKDWKPAQIKEKLDEWAHPNQSGQLKAYCGIVIWYLQRKLRQA